MLDGETQQHMQRTHTSFNALGLEREMRCFFVFTEREREEKRRGEVKRERRRKENVE